MKVSLNYIRLKPAAAAVLAGALLAAQPAHSHHSFAMFDRTREVTITGTVKNFQWTNPHSWLQVNAQSAKGVVEWSIELGSPNTMVRQGWRKTSFKPGDKVALVINPMRDGSYGGAFVSAVNSAGKKLP
jgi:hypothetical protein